MRCLTSLFVSAFLLVFLLNACRKPEEERFVFATINGEAYTWKNKTIHPIGSHRSGVWATTGSTFNEQLVITLDKIKATDDDPEFHIQFGLQQFTGIGEYTDVNVDIYCKPICHYGQILDPAISITEIDSTHVSGTFRFTATASPNQQMNIECPDTLAIEGGQFNRVRILEYRQ